MNGNPIIITVKKEKLKRVAVISSNILLQNHTRLPLEMTTVNQGEVSSIIRIPPDNQKYPVEFNKIDSTVLFNMNEALGQGLDLTSINRTKKQSVNMPLKCPHTQYNNLVLDVYTKGLITFIDIKPALVVSNFCPVPIHFTMNCKKQEFTQTVFRSNPIEIFKFDPYREPTAISLTVNEHFSTTLDLTKLLAKDSKRSITLFDTKETGLKIHIELEHNRLLNTIMIYTKFNIFNETGLDLEFYSFNPSVSGQSHKLVGNGNNTVLFQSEKSHTTFMVKANSKTFEECSYFPRDLLESVRGSSFFPKNISYNLNDKVAGGVGDSYYEYDIAIIPNVVKLQEGILTKTITIAPQYVVMNSTAFSLRIIQQSGGGSMTVKSNQRQPIVWRTLQKSVAVQILEPGKE